METEQNIKVIITVPNQKVVTVKHSICDKDHIYATCNIKANKIALKELSPNAYKLYMYFDLNQNNYTFALSFADVHEITGMSDKTYQKSINELIEKGYLVKSENHKNFYTFYDGKINGDYRKVEITQREEKVFLTDENKTPYKEGLNYLTGEVETTGEILQYNTKNNTINNNDAPDTNGALDAALASDASLDINTISNINFESNLFSNDDIMRIMKISYLEKKDKYKDNNSMLDFLTKEFTGNNYNCKNKQSVINYANYIISNNTITQ